MKNIYLPSLEVLLPREVEVHYKRPLFDSLTHVSSSNDANNYLRKCINLKRIDHKEFFWVLLLNRANRLIGFSEIGKGNDVGVVINHKEIFQLALLTNAHSLIVCHNHPSGQLTISEGDKRETRKLQAMGELMDIHLLDHLIITSESFISFSDMHQL